MPKREFHFAAISKITLVHEQGDGKSILKASDLRLEVSGNLDRSMYIDGKGLPRKDAVKPITLALIMGLITNMRMGAAKGWWKEGEHMKYITEQLQRAFVTPGTAEQLVSQVKSISPADLADYTFTITSTQMTQAEFEAMPEAD